MSAEGEARQTLPTTVARFRTWIEPSEASAAWKFGYFAAHERQALELPGGDEGAEGEAAGLVPAGAREAGNVLDVDDVADAAETFPDLDEKVGAAGEKERLGAEFGRRSERLLQGRRLDGIRSVS